MELDGDNNDAGVSRLGVTFHRTFSLNRAAIRQIIKLVNERGGLSKLSRKDFLENTTLGSIYVESMPRWAWGSGLLSKDKDITAFGKFASDYDPFLETIGTQWLMHYYLSALQGPGPAFWNEVVSKFFYYGNIFSTDSLVDCIGNYVWRTENKVLQKRSVHSTATVFLGTYLKPEGLAKLNILEETGSGRYRVREPVRPPKWAVACALVNYWAANYPGRLGIGLDTLQESNFLKIFMLGKNDFMDVLQAMQEIGYVNIHRAAPPFQVLLRRQDQEGVLQKLYGTD